MRYGWTIEEIGKLNATQANMMLAGDESGGKIIPFDSLEEAAEFQRKRRAANV